MVGLLMNNEFGSTWPEGCVL